MDRRVVTFACAMALALVLTPCCKDDDMLGGGPSIPLVATVRLVPDAPRYRVGDVVGVAVTSEGASNVGSIALNIQFVPSVLEFSPPAVEGSFLRSDGAPTVVLAGSSSPGEILVAASRMGTVAGASGSGEVARFAFRALAAGTSPLTLDGSVKNPQARNLPVRFESAVVIVDPAAPSER